MTYCLTGFGLGIIIGVLLWINNPKMSTLTPLITGVMLGLVFGLIMLLKSILFPLEPTSQSYPNVEDEKNEC